MSVSNSDVQDIYTYAPYISLIYLQTYNYNWQKRHYRSSGNLVTFRNVYSLSNARVYCIHMRMFNVHVVRTRILRIERRIHVYWGLDM